MTWPTYRLGEIIESFQSGFACGDKGVADGFKHLRMNNIHADGRIDLSLVRTVPTEMATARYRLQPDDVLVCTTNSGKLVGKSALFGIAGDYAFSNHLTRLRMRRDIADPTFVQKQLWFKWVHGEIEPLCKHWVNQSTLPKEELLDLDIALPRVEEQRRISKILDHVAVRLDDTSARLEAIPTILKRFRMSVHAAACSGRLTADWRKQRGIEIESWDATTLGELACLITSGSRGWAKYYSPSGALFVRAQNINTDKLILDDIAYVSPPKNTEGARTRVLLSDLLVTITGANVTKTALVENDLGEAYVSQHVGLVRLKNSELAQYVYLWLSNGAPGRTQLLDAAYGAGKPGLSLGNLREVAVLLPSEAERFEIFQQVTNLLTQAEIIEARYLTAKTFTDRLMPSVLAKAFRGALVERDKEEIQNG